MKLFRYTVKDDLGIHARPAGLLVREAMNWQSEIVIDNGERQVSARRVTAVMSLGVRKGDTATVFVEGEDEGSACAGMEHFFRKNL